MLPLRIAGFHEGRKKCAKLSACAKSAARRKRSASSTLFFIETLGRIRVVRAEGRLGSGGELAPDPVPEELERSVYI